MSLTKKGQNPIKYTKGRNANSLKAREVFKIIGKTIDMPHERVQDVFQAWYEIVMYCMEKNIDIPLLNIGVITVLEHKPLKVGDIQHIPKGFCYIDDEGVVQRATENLNRVVTKDIPAWNIPKVKFYPSFKNNVKEKTYH